MSTPSDPLRLELESRFEHLLADLASRFVNLPAEEVEAQIERAQRQLCALLGFDRSTLWLAVGPGEPPLQLMWIVQPSGLPEPPLQMDASSHFPWLSERMFRGEEALLSSLDDLPAEAATDRESLERFNTRSSGMFPIRAGGRILGLLTFATTATRQDWNRQTVARLRLVAQVFGGVLIRKANDEQRRQSEAALRDLTSRLIQARDRERAWLARELHDGLNQHLAMLAVELDLLAQYLPGTPVDVQSRLGDMAAQIRVLSGEVHRLSHGLHPSKLERLGLASAVGGFCRELEEAEAVKAEFAAEGIPGNLPGNLALCLYRVAQECLWNVVRHSGATRAGVTLRGTPDAIELQITDDGRGFDVAAALAGDTLGLTSLRERVAMVGGEIRFESDGGAGTTVTARVPLPPEVSQ